VAAAWLGHSTLVARKHYWQITDADFERALTQKSGAQSGSALHGNASQGTETEMLGLPQVNALQGFAASCGVV
jgi:hypothetical protein